MLTIFVYIQTGSLATSQIFTTSPDTPHLWKKITILINWREMYKRVDYINWISRDWKRTVTSITLGYQESVKTARHETVQLRQPYVITWTASCWEEYILSDFPFNYSLASLFDYVFLSGVGVAKMYEYQNWEDWERSTVRVIPQSELFLNILSRIQFLNRQTIWMLERWTIASSRTFDVWCLILTCSWAQMSSE